MSGQWKGSDRAKRLPPDWQRRRVRVLKRDGYQCTWFENGVRCPARAVDVDHVDRNAGDEEQNLRSLCEPHHDKKSSIEGNAARPKRRREPERHPGLV